MILTLSRYYVTHVIMDMTIKNVKPVEINTSVVTDVLNTQCTFIQIFIKKACGWCLLPSWKTDLTTTTKLLILAFS